MRKAINCDFPIYEERAENFRFIDLFKMKLILMCGDFNF